MQCYVVNLCALGHGVFMAQKSDSAVKTAQDAGGENSKKTSGGPRLRSLEIMYRPVFDVSLNMAIDYEASVRINDPQIGVVLPEVYMPVAEKTNQICDLNKWSIEEACDAILRCEKREADINRVILPVSVRYLSKKNMAAQAAKIVDGKGVSPDKICFNITESIFEAQRTSVTASIIALREAGFLVSIDDFGVEFTSMTHLGQYAVDYVGLHASLTERLLDDERTQNMVQGIIDFVNKLDAQVRVDGVDSEEKYKLLKTMGAGQMKGPLYGEPLHERQIKIV